MAACDSLQHMFDAPLTSEPSPLSSSWNPQLGRPSPAMPRSSSVTELFGELHFEESPAPPSALPPPSPTTSSNADVFDAKSHENERKEAEYVGSRHRSGGSLQLCTEGLGFESLGDVEDVSGDDGRVEQQERAEGDDDDDDDGGGGYYCFWGARKRGSGPMLRRWRSTVVTRRERVAGGRSCLPPPISIVNRPWVSLRGYRCDGRFMLKEVTVPAREFLHASREGGRLRLDFVQGVQDDDDDDDNDSDSDDGANDNICECSEDEGKEQQEDEDVIEDDNNERGRKV